MALKTDNAKPDTKPDELVDEVAAPISELDLPPGFHVMHDGVSLGCYPTAEDAEAFADAHPRPSGLIVTVEEV